MKYEAMATSRVFLPLYGLILLLSCFIHIFLPLNSDTFDTPRIITMMVYMFLMAALFVMTLVVTIQRFQKNLLGDEGYLSFTLPVKTWDHIVSKMIVTLMWSFFTLIVSFFSVFLLAVGDKQSLKTFSEGCMEIGDAFNRYGGWAWLILAEAVVFLVIAIFSGTLQIYAAVSVGHLSPKHKLLAGFGAFVGFCIVEQIIASLFSGYIEANSLLWATIDVTPSMISTCLLVCIGFSAVFGAAFFFLTEWILKRKLNLE